MSNVATSLRGRPWLLLPAAVAAVIGAVLVALMVLPAFADHDPQAGASSANADPVFVDNNPTCSDFFDAGEFLFEFKYEPVEDAVIPLSFNGINFELTVEVDEGAKTFDFSFSNGFGVIGVVVKGGPNANLYDYSPNGVTNDQGLHAPVQNPGPPEKYFGLSHISFCIVQLETQIEIVKTAVDDTITIGGTFAYDITVSDVADGIDAQNVEIFDALEPDGHDWTITGGDPDGVCQITDDDTDGHVDDLYCAVGTLADGTSYSVTVTDETATAADCDTTYTNTAFATADNADPVDDDATITVQCGGVKVVKTAKHADTSGATSANLAATFRITDSNGDTHDVTTDAVTGIACVDDLPLGAATVDEIDGPDGYAEDDDVENVTVTDADCPEPGAGATASFENIPLTDISWTVDSQHDGATSTLVECFDADGNLIASASATVSDGSADILNLEPTDPTITVTCEFTIDP